MNKTRPTENNKQNIPQSRGEKMRTSAQVRKQRKKRRDTFVLFCLFVFLLAVALILSLTVLFNAESIGCENAGVRYTDAQIIEVSGIEAGDNMFRLNKTYLEEKIEKELPYIGEAKIKRKLPDAILISVEYTSASLAVESTDGTFVLLNSSGKVLETGVQFLADYVAQISGVELLSAVEGETAEFTDEAMLENLTSVTKAFEENGLNQVTAYDFSDLNNVTVEIDYSIDVIFGKINQVEEKIAFGKEVILKNMNTAHSGKIIIDLTKDNVASVRTQNNIDAADEAASSAYAELNSELTETVTQEKNENE